MARTSATPTVLDVLTQVHRVTPDAWRRLGWLRRYLITARAAVLPLTASSCLFGGLLSLPLTPEEGWRLTLATLALVLSHAAGNLLGDQLERVLESDRGSFRARYGAHPLAQGLTRPFSHLAALGITVLLAVLFVGAVCRMVGSTAYWLAGVGALLLLFGTWPLRRRGLGEAVVFLVWGPLMAGGVYWVVSGDWGPDILLLTMLFGLGPMVLSLARHADERPHDASRRIRTLPVRLGPLWGPRLAASVALLQTAVVATWACTAGAWPYLLMLAALPALLTLVGVCLRRRPPTRPAGFPRQIWPHWYTAAGLRYARAAGLAMVAAALVNGL